MIKKVLLAITILFMLGIGMLFYLVAPLVATPKFFVINKSDVTVSVTAHWREKVKDFGKVPAGSKIEFEVKDEAAMVFHVTFPNGMVVSSSPAIYFTSGTVTDAVITESTVEVSTAL